MKTKARYLLVLGLAAGCAAPTSAVVDGHAVPRPNLGYTDHNIYALAYDHAYPQPRGPSSGLHAFGGTLWGRVCGSDVNFEAQYRGRYLDVSGFAAPALASGRLRGDQPMRFQARDRHGEREVIGYFPLAALDGPYGPPQIDFRYNLETFKGTIGWRTFDLHR